MIWAFFFFSFTNMFASRLLPRSLPPSSAEKQRTPPRRPATAGEKGEVSVAVEVVMAPPSAAKSPSRPGTQVHSALEQAKPRSFPPSATLFFHGVQDAMPWISRLSCGAHIIGVASESLRVSGARRVGSSPLHCFCSSPFWRSCCAWTASPILSIEGADERELLEIFMFCVRGRCIACVCA